MSSEDLDTVLGFDLKNPKQVDELIALLTERIEKEGMAIRDALEISESTMEFLYELGYSLYNSGLYKKALDVFRNLSLLDVSSYRYAFGLAATCHRLEDYTNALTAYMAAFLIESTNPTPLFYGAHCFVKMGNLSAASDLWDNVVILAKNRPEYAHLGEEAALLKAGITKK